jgi:hypothetical protein
MQTLHLQLVCIFEIQNLSFATKVYNAPIWGQGGGPKVDTFLLQTIMNAAIQMKFKMQVSWLDCDSKPVKLTNWSTTTGCWVITQVHVCIDVQIIGRALRRKAITRLAFMKCLTCKGRMALFYRVQHKTTLLYLSMGENCSMDKCYFQYKHLFYHNDILPFCQFFSNYIQIFQIITMYLRIDKFLTL